MGGLLGLPAPFRRGARTGGGARAVPAAVLYRESLNTSLREIRANLRAIVLAAWPWSSRRCAVAYAPQALGVEPRGGLDLGAGWPDGRPAVAGLAKRIPRRTPHHPAHGEPHQRRYRPGAVRRAVEARRRRDADPPAPLAGPGRRPPPAASPPACSPPARVMLDRRRLDDPKREGGLSILRRSSRSCSPSPCTPAASWPSWSPA